MPFQVQKTDGNSTTFVDPTKPDRFVRVKQTSVPKFIDGVPVANWITEIIAGTRVGFVPEGGAPENQVIDTLSVRMRISGAAESTVPLQALADLVCHSVKDLWTDEHVLIGFTPTTVPADPP